MKDRDVDWLLAVAQVGFAGLLLLAIIALVGVLVLVKNQLSETGTTILTSVIAALITILTLQMNFFYARTRPAAIPDPNTTTVSTTSVTTPPPLIVPEGSKVVPPAGAPAAAASVTFPPPVTPAAS